MPIVSIIVPVFNESVENLSLSLSSVANQTFKDFECIIIDESTDPILMDKCAEICIKDSRFIYVHTICRLGLSESLNLGLNIAKGQYISRFDSDDICHLERIQKQVEYLNQNQNIGVVGSWVDRIDAMGGRVGVKKYPITNKSILYRLHFVCPLAHPAVTFRAEIPRSFGGYNSQLKYSEDLDLWLRWSSKGVQFYNIPLAMIKYRERNIIRPKEHWRANLNVRISNISRTKIILKLLGIGLIYCWWILPEGFKEYIRRGRKKIY